MGQQVTDKDIMDFLRYCGLPALYRRREIGLHQYGELGARFKEILGTAKARKEFLDGRSIINFHSKHGVAADKFLFMALRELMIVESFDGDIIPAYMSVLDLVNGDERTLALYGEADIIGIDDFHLSEERERFPLDDEREYELYRLVKKHINNGGYLLISSDRPLSKFCCFPQGFTAYLREQGKDVEVDAS